MKSLIWWSVTWRPGTRAVLSGETTYCARPAGRDHQEPAHIGLATLIVIDANLSP